MTETMFTIGGFVVCTRATWPSGYYQMNRPRELKNILVLPFFHESGFYWVLRGVPGMSMINVTQIDSNMPPGAFS